MHKPQYVYGAAGSFPGTPPYNAFRFNFTGIRITVSESVWGNKARVRPLRLLLPHCSCFSSVASPLAARHALLLLLRRLPCCYCRYSTHPTRCSWRCSCSCSARPSNCSCPAPPPAPAAPALPPARPEDADGRRQRKEKRQGAEVLRPRLLLRLRRLDADSVGGHTWI